ncbi:MAG: cobalamin-dependent protein [Pseudomonadota bacterium]
MSDVNSPEQNKRILMAKTGLDGHWRGPTIVATALRDAGFEVIMIGMVKAEEVVQAAIDEDVDLIGLNIGGHIDVAVRAVQSIQQSCQGVPVFAGGVVPPHAKRKLEALGVEVYPPGSQLPEIVSAARRLTGLSGALPASD